MSGQTQKEIGLTMFVLAASAAVLSLFALAATEAPSVVVLALAAGAALIWAALAALAFALVGPVAATALILSIPFITVAAGSLQVGVLAAAVPLVAALAVARWRIRDQIGDTLAFRPARIFYGGLRWILLGLLLAAAGLAVAPVRTNMRTADITLPEEFVSVALRPIEPLLSGTVPPGAPPLVPLVTAVLNNYLNAVLHNNPLLSAFAAVVALLFVSRLLVSLAAWPSLLVTIVFVLIARQTRVAYLVSKPVESSRLQLTEKEDG